MNTQKLIFDIIRWLIIWYVVKLAGLTGNPGLLLAAIVYSYYVVVIKGPTDYRTPKNGD